MHFSIFYLVFVALFAYSQESGDPYQVIWNNYDCDTFIATAPALTYQFYDQPDVINTFPPEVVNQSVSILQFFVDENVTSTQKMQPYMDAACPLVRNTTSFLLASEGMANQDSCTLSFRNYGLIIMALIFGALALIAAFIYGKKVSTESGTGDQPQFIFLAMNMFLFLSGVLLAGGSEYIHILGILLIMLSTLGVFCSQSNHSAAFFFYFTFAVYVMFSLIGHNLFGDFTSAIWEYSSTGCNNYFGSGLPALPAPIPAQSVNGLMYCNVEGSPMTCSLIADASQVRCGDCQYLVSVAVFGYFSAWVCSFTALIAFVESFIGRSWGMVAK